MSGVKRLPRRSATAGQEVRHDGRIIRVRAMCAAAGDDAPTTARRPVTGRNT
jgi:hypothetical protein